MAQLKAVSPCPSLAATLNPRIKGFLVCKDRVSVQNKPTLFHQLGAERSELGGIALGSNCSNVVRTGCNKAIQAVVSSGKDTEVVKESKGKGLRGKLNKVVLAYSGGLDTSVIVPWLSWEIYDQADAAGFIRLYGLPTRVRAMLEKGI